MIAIKSGSCNDHPQMWKEKKDRASNASHISKVDKKNKMLAEKKGPNMKNMKK